MDPSADCTSEQATGTNTFFNHTQGEGGETRTLFQRRSHIAALSVQGRAPNGEARRSSKALFCFSHNSNIFIASVDLGRASDGFFQHPFSDHALLWNDTNEHTVALIYSMPTAPKGGTYPKVIHS